MSNIKDKIKDLIVEDDLKAALKELNTINVTDPDLQRQILLLNFDINGMQQDFDNGIILGMNYKLMVQRTKMTFVQLLDKLQLD